MGQHTWFHKSKEMYFKALEILEVFSKACDKEPGYEHLDEHVLFDEYDELIKKSEYKHHDLFRTSKRTPDGEYIEDEIISSKEECDLWLEANKNTVSELQKELVDEFWKKYPKGFIRFG